MSSGVEGGTPQVSLAGVDLFIGGTSSIGGAARSIGAVTSWFVMGDTRDNTIKQHRWCCLELGMYLVANSVRYIGGGAHTESSRLPTQIFILRSLVLASSGRTTRLLYTTRLSLA